MKQDNILPQPDNTICPKHYCFHWLEKGSYIARGLHSSLEEAFNYMEEALESGCVNSFGFCRRDERIQNFKKSQPYQRCKDWYEPCEPALDKDGLPHDYFIAPKYTPKDDTKDENTEG